MRDVDKATKTICLISRLRKESVKNVPSTSFFEGPKDNYPTMSSSGIPLKFLKKLFDLNKFFNEIDNILIKPYSFVTILLFLFYFSLLFKPKLQIK